MLISFTMGVVLAVLAGAAAFALIFFGLKSIKAGQKAGVITGSIVGIIAGAFVMMMAGRAVVVTGENEAGTYLVYGSPTYEFSNGFKLKLTMKSLDAYVINDSDQELVLEKIIYTSSYSVEDYYDVLIEPMSITKMPGTSVHYFFNDTPPDEIETSSSSGDVTKYWLRSRDSYENEYGAMLYDTDYKSIPAVPHNTASE